MTDSVRALLLRAPEGRRTANVPILPPPGLEPPEILPDADNGYVALCRLVDRVPQEGHVAPDLLHWRDRVSTERKTGERVLAPWRPLLEALDPVLDAPLWQVPVGDTIDWPEMKGIRRLGQALLLRAAVDGSRIDGERAVWMAQRVRRAQGMILHLLIGFLMEREAGGPFEGLAEDRHEAFRWEIARIVVPFAHRIGPWEPPNGPDFGNSADERRAVAWALSGHPESYDPQGFVEMYLAEREALAGAPSTELRRRAQDYVRPWPEPLLTPGGFGGRAPLLALRGARTALRETSNPYGRLSLSQTLNVVAGMVEAMEKSTRPSGEGVSPPGL